MTTIRTQDKVELAEGEKAFNYYDMKPGTIERIDSYAQPDTMAGQTSSTPVAEWTNYWFEFRHDDGSGYVPRWLSDLLSCVRSAEGMGEVMNCSYGPDAGDHEAIFNVDFFNRHGRFAETNPMCQACFDSVAPAFVAKGGSVVARPIETTMELRRRVADLAQVLVHDCDPGSEHCYCFGQGDVDAYNEAREELSARAEAAQS